MSNPITWKNVGSSVKAPDLSGVSDIMERAQQGFNNAFAGANTLIDERQNIEQGNQENQVRLNTEQFDQTLRSRYKTPEEFEAARASGAIQAERDKYGQYGLDTDKTNAVAIDSLVSGMQTRQLNDWQYEDKVQQRADAPIVSELLNARDNITTANGIEGIRTGVQDLRSEIAARVEAGELSETGARQLYSSLAEQRDTLENRFWNETDRARQEEIYQNDRTASKYGAAQNNALRNAEMSVNSRIESINQRLADEHGLDPNQITSEAYLSGLTPEQLMAAEQAVEEIKGIEVPNSRQYADDVYDDVLEKTGDHATALKAMQVFNAEWTARNQPTAENQAAYEREMSSWESRMDKNGYYKWEEMDERDRTQAINDTIDETSEIINGRWNGIGWFSNREEATDFIRNSMTSGIDVDGETLVLTPEEAKHVMKTLHDGNFADANPETVLSDIVGKNDSWLTDREQYLTYKTFRNARQAQFEEESRGYVKPSTLQSRYSQFDTAKAQLQSRREEEAANAEAQRFKQEQQAAARKRMEAEQSKKANAQVFKGQSVFKPKDAPEGPITLDGIREMAREKQAQIAEDTKAGSAKRASEMSDLNNAIRILERRLSNKEVEDEFGTLNGAMRSNMGRNPATGAMPEQRYPNIWGR